MVHSRRRVARYYGPNATRHLTDPRLFWRDAKSRNSIKTELAGQLLANKRAAIQPRTTMMQVEAVVKMLQPGFNIASIAAERRNKSSPWFGRRAAAR
jgi:hypothetical protein